MPPPRMYRGRRGGKLYNPFTSALISKIRKGENKYARRKFGREGGRMPRRFKSHPFSPVTVVTAREKRERERK